MRAYTSGTALANFLDLPLVMLLRLSYLSDWDQLFHLSNANPLEGVVLTLSPLETSDTVLVTGLAETIPDLLLKWILMDYLKERDSVKSVTRLSCTHALVVFTSHQSEYVHNL